MKKAFEVILLPVAMIGMFVGPIAVAKTFVGVIHNECSVFSHFVVILWWILSTWYVSKTNKNDQNK